MKSVSFVNIVGIVFGASLRSSTMLNCDVADTGHVWSTISTVTRGVIRRLIHERNLVIMVLILIDILLLFHTILFPAGFWEICPSFRCQSRIHFRDPLAFAI